MIGRYLLPADSSSITFSGSYLNAVASRSEFRSISHMPGASPRLVSYVSLKTVFIVFVLLKLIQSHPPFNIYRYKG